LRLQLFGTKIVMLVATLLILGAPMLGAAEERGDDYWQDQIERISQRLMDLPLPAGWAGVWNFDASFQDCDTQVEFFRNSWSELLCEGDPFDDELTCTGTWGDTSADVSCSGVFAGPVCTETVQETFTATRNGDSASYVLIESITFTGAECTEEDFCLRAVVTMTRTAPAPVPCDSTPVEEANWGQIKVLFQ
jgi:hypothetical protein